MLTYDDIVEARRFDDAVALCGDRVDIHGYDGGPVYDQPERGTQVKAYGSYAIPYRCLLPRGVENLLVAGRCVSATLSVQEGLTSRQLPYSLLMETLLVEGAMLA